jgi:hypothetical protein
MRTSRAKLVALIGWTTVAGSIGLITWLYATAPGQGWPVAMGELTTTPWQPGQKLARRLGAGAQAGFYESNYVYWVNGSAYFGHGVTSQKWPNTDIEVHYNPDNPTESVLSNEPNGAAVFVLIALGLAGFVVAKVASAGTAPSARR